MPVHQSNCQFANVFVIYKLQFLKTGLFLLSSIHPFAGMHALCLSIHTTIHLSIHPSVCLFISLSIGPFVCMFVLCLPIYTSVYPSIHIYVYPSNCQIAHVCPMLCMLVLCLHFCPSVLPLMLQSLCIFL